MIKVGKQETTSPVWHPNFGDASALPDIKVVRTGFFYSALAVTVAVMVAMFVGFREFQMSNLEENIANLEKEISGYGKRHNDVITQNRKFLDLKRKVDELDAFVSDQLVASDFLLVLGESLSEEMAITRVTYTEENAIVSGTIHSGADEASMIFDTYKAKLRDANAAQSLFDNYDAKSLKRDEKEGVLEFGIEMYKTIEKPAKKGKKDD